MGYQIDADGTIIRPDREKENNSKNGWFWKVCLILGLLAFVFALVFLITRQSTTEEKRLTSRELHHFVGNVGADIHMSILVEDTKVMGLYYYDRQRKNGNFSSLKLSGEKNGNRIRLTETCDGKTTGWFDGNMALGVFKGAFTRAKDGKVFDFTLAETGNKDGFFTEDDIVFYCH